MTTPNNGRLSAEVLHADYAYHYKPYQTAKRVLNYYYFRLQVEGQCIALFDGKPDVVSPGDLLIYRPGDVACFQFVRTAEQQPGKSLISGNYYMSCRGSWLDDWSERSGISGCIKASLNESVLTLFREIVEEHRQARQHRGAVSDYLLRAMCLRMERIAAEHKQPDNHPSRLTEKMKQFVMENATSSFRLEDVANEVGISVPHAVALFKAAFGMTIMQYAMEVRLAIACDRIRFTMANLDRIAESTGFGSYSYFHRVFRAKYGISPKQYRDQQ